MYVDLPAGDHVVSAGDMRLVFGGFRKGKNSIQVGILDGRATYVRIDAAGPNEVYPRAVAAVAAVAEMENLPIDTHFVSFECRTNKAEERGT
jgi:hypothetical protein